MKFVNGQCGASLEVHLGSTSAFCKWKLCEICKTIMWNVTRAPLEFHKFFSQIEVLVKLMKWRCGAPQDRILHVGNLIVIIMTCETTAQDIKRERKVLVCKATRT